VVRKRTATTQFLEASPLLVEALAAHITATEQAAALVVAQVVVLQKEPEPMHRVMTVVKAQTAKTWVGVVVVLEALVKLAHQMTTTTVVPAALV
jgi:hypothetical protein